MAMFNCFCVVPRKKKQIKGDDRSSNYKTVPRSIPVRQENSQRSSKADEIPINLKAKSICKMKVMNHESPDKFESLEVAYEAEDEQEEFSSVKRDVSNLELQADSKRGAKQHMEPTDSSMFEFRRSSTTAQTSLEPEKDTEFIQSGHVSDPGFEKARLWGTPKLKRSCSNLETRNVLKKMGKQLPFSHSYENLQEVAERMRMNHRDPGSPAMSHRSADRVILKKHSSSQILPSRSRKLWWKLFLWSHRNLHNNSWASIAQPFGKIAVWNQQGGYCSDTLEPNRPAEASKVGSPRSFTADSFCDDNETSNQCENPNWKSLHGRGSGLWPQSQWVAFSTESSSLTRVDEWVRDLEIQPDNNSENCINFPPSPENGRSPSRSSAQLPLRLNSEEMLHANTVIQSLTSSSTAAHIAGIGLKVIPTISPFSSLRTINLSSNSIVHITPGSLPKGLHTLDLSRNNISTIEGLKDLARLRILDLSYNRISRIEHGLSNCPLIKELYLAGNKISYVEGLHRLTKLAVLDLSFNKITTTKALGQLVANYNSLLAINLLGNPIQSNINEEQIRKAVTGLLPKLAYLNKQAIKPQRAREVLNDNVARAVLGSNNRGSRRRAANKVSQGGLLASNLHRSKDRSGHGSRHSSRGRSHNPSSLHRPSTLTSSSR